MGFLEIFMQVAEVFVPSKAVLEDMQFLLTVIIVLLAVKIFGSLSVHIGQPPVFGKLIVGLLVGPSFLGLVHETELMIELARIGVLLLMFIAGVETDIEEVFKSAKAAVLAAFLGIAVPLFTGYWLAAAYGFGWSSSLFVGTILVATSVSISVQTLKDLGKLRSPEGFTILGAAVIDDILGLVTLSVILGLTLGGGIGTAGIAVLLLKIAVFFAAGLTAGIVLIPRLLDYSVNLGVTVPILTIGIVIALGYAVIAEFMGIAGVMGSYLAGLIVSRTGYKYKLFESMEIVGYSFFIPFFFISIGAAADIRNLTGELVTFTIVVSAAAVLAKLIGCGAGAVISGMNLRSSLGVGAGMTARGEVALIVSKIGLDSGLIGESLFTSMVVVAIATTIITPPLLRLVFNDGEKTAPNTT